MIIFNNNNNKNIYLFSKQTTQLIVTTIIQLFQVLIHQINTIEFYLNYSMF